jgi:hypothetical protein
MHVLRRYSKPAANEKLINSQKINRWMACSWIPRDVRSEAGDETREEKQKFVLDRSQVAKERVRELIGIQKSTGFVSRSFATRDRYAHLITPPSMRQKIGWLVQIQKSVYVRDSFQLPCGRAYFRDARMTNSRLLAVYVV